MNHDTRLSSAKQLHLITGLVSTVLFIWIFLQEKSVSIDWLQNPIFLILTLSLLSLLSLQLQKLWHHHILPQALKPYPLWTWTVIGGFLGLFVGMSLRYSQVSGMYKTV